MTDLTERLRDGICYTALGTLDDEMTDNLMYEAATTLETLTQENARLREALEGIAEAYDDACNYDMLTANLEHAVESASKALGGGDEQ